MSVVDKRVVLTHSVWDRSRTGTAEDALTVKFGVQRLELTGTVCGYLELE
jgi:hypothetical protein